PEAGNGVARKQDDGVESSPAHDSPKAGIHRVEKTTSTCPGRDVRQIDPWISIQQRNIPFHLNAEARIQRRLGTTQTAVCNKDFHVCPLRQQLELRYR